jgi:hypothetical protein
LFEIVRGLEGREKKRAGAAFGAQRPGTQVGVRGNFAFPFLKQIYQVFVFDYEDCLNQNFCINGNIIRR